MELVNVEGIVKSFGQGGGKTVALNGLDLSIAEGEFTCIWGASGSGKSTLLNIIGLIDKPDQGKVTMAGENVLALNEDALADFRNEKIGFIFQNFNLVPVFNALENAVVPLQIAGINEKEAYEKAEHYLNLVGLSEHKDKYPDQMSGGQRQRVAIARALITEPKLVLADEPTANLDSKNSQVIIGLMKELNRDLRTTFIFSTHDNLLLNHASRNIFLRDGQLKDTNPQSETGKKQGNFDNQLDGMKIYETVK